MEAASWILCYLKFSPGKGLMFSRHEHLKIEAYTDGDWAGFIMDQRSHQVIVQLWEVIWLHCIAKNNRWLLDLV